jgi:hypothetical protein
MGILENNNSKKQSVMRRFEINSEESGRLWVKSCITGKIYLVELANPKEQGTNEALYTRILVSYANNTALKNKSVTGAIRLQPGVNPLPFIEQLDNIKQ